MESAELIAILREVRERVRARHPQGDAPGNVPLTDLLPLVHARDRAAAKVASIGTVNPRRGGPVNALVQAWKRLVARMLDWHVREQVVFNRNVMESIDAALEALNGNNRAISELAGRVATALEQGEEMKDLRARWAEWHVEWEQKLQQTEVQFLRSVADLQAAFQHRVTLMDASYRDAAQKGSNEIWANLERMRVEYERLIHQELRLIRQRAQLPLPDGRGSGATPMTYGREVVRYRAATVRERGFVRLHPLRRTLPWLGGVRQTGPAVLSALFRGPRQRARHRLRPR